MRKCKMARARWSNGCSFAVEFDFSPSNSEESLTNALNALQKFTAEVHKSAIGNHQCSIIAYLHVQWGGKNWGNPVRIGKIESGEFAGGAFTSPVNVRIIPSSHGYPADEALCISQWGVVFPLMVNVIRHDASLGKFINDVSEDINLQADLDDWDNEIRGGGTK
jgi:hypothetical protein